MVGTMLALGIASRSGVLVPALAKPAGVAMWCALVYWIIAGLLPRLSIRRICFGAIATGWGVEFMQLTPLPAWLASVFPPTRWVLGRVFHGPDLAWYAVGALFAAGMHGLIRVLYRSDRL